MNSVERLDNINPIVIMTKTYSEDPNGFSGWFSLLLTGEIKLLAHAPRGERLSNQTTNNQPCMIYSFIQDDELLKELVDIALLGLASKNLGAIEVMYYDWLLG